MATLNNIRISLRNDCLSNWISLNPVLNAGELAIVTGYDGNQLFKIGDGSTPFSDLPFMNENEVKTKAVIADEVTAKSISQGVKASSVPLGFASGAYISANANFSQALGYDAMVSSGHNYSFVWNGDDSRVLSDYYTSKGKGTFNINPKNGFEGLFIGEESFGSILGSLSTSVESMIPTMNSQLSNDEQYAKVFFDQDGVGVPGDLSVHKVTRDEYAERVLNDDIQPNELFIVSGDNIDAWGGQISNVTMAEKGETYLGVAATKPYVDELSAKVSSFIEAFNIPSISGDPILAEFIEQPDTVDISVAVYAVCYMFKKLLHQ